MDKNSVWLHYPQHPQQQLEQPSGKWMLFYRNEDIDEAWEKAKNQFPDLQLAGISAMKCSNRFVENPRASNNVTQVIVFYCGPATEEERIKNIGRDLIRIMEYKAPTSNKINYKADSQTFSGTRARGTQVNHLYSLPVESLFAQRNPDDEEEPANEFSTKVFYKTKPEWAYKISRLPTVRLQLSPEHIYHQWRRAKNLLVSDKLINECVAVDCETMATERAQNSLLMTMKFYLNIDVTKEDPDQMKKFIRDICNSMQIITGKTIGLYQSRRHKPFIQIEL